MDNENIQVQEETTTKTFTMDEVEQMIAEGRKKALDEATKRADERFAARQREAEKLAQMNENQKREYELEQRENAIAEKEKALAMAENRTVASSILLEKGISTKLVDFVVDTDAEIMNNNISLLEREFKASVKAEVEKRLGSSAPKKNFVEPDQITKADLLKMPINKLQEMLNTNPDLANLLK